VRRQFCSRVVMATKGNAIGGTNTNELLAGWNEVTLSHFGAICGNQRACPSRWLFRWWSSDFEWQNLTNMATSYNLN
jgi:hypothetical protein